LLLIIIGSVIIIFMFSISSPIFTGMFTGMPTHVSDDVRVSNYTNYTQTEQSEVPSDVVHEEQPTQPEIVGNESEEPNEKPYTGFGSSGSSSGSSATSCTPNWYCDEWSECTDGIRTRTCYDGCGDSRVETQTCQYTFLHLDSTNVSIGNNFTIDIVINTTSKVYAYDISLSYNPEIVEALEIIEGGFLNRDGSQTFNASKIINNTEGYVKFASTRFNTKKGINGTGVLFAIQFHAKQTGNSMVNFEEISIVDENVETVLVSSENGTINVF